MSTDRFAEFTDIDFDFTTQEQPTDPAALLLPPGYLSAIDPRTGQVVAVRIADQPAATRAPVAQPAAAVSETALGKAPGPSREQLDPLPEPERPLSAFERAQLYAREQPQPVPAVAPPPAQGASPLAGQVVVLGGIASLSMLAAGCAIYIACAGLHTAGPFFHDAGEFMKYASVFIVAAAVAAVVAVRKLKSAMTSRATGDGTVVNALVHRHTEVTIGRQSGGFWKGQIHNNVN